MKTPEALLLLQTQARSLLARYPELLRSLPNEDLIALHKALGQLGLTTEQALTAKAVGRRQETAVKAFVPSMQKLAVAAQQGKVDQVLTTARQMYLDLGRLSLVFQSLGTKLSDTPEQKAFLQQQLNDAVAALPDDQRAALKSYLERPELRELASTSHLVGLIQEDIALGNTMMNLADLLVMTAHAVGAPMAPPVPKPGVEPGSDASQTVAQALYGQFGVVVGKGHTETSLWMAKDQPHVVFRELLTDPVRQPLLTKFAAFCDNQYCRENLDFWQGVQALRQAPSAADAQLLFDRFILATGANDTQINIDSGTVAQLTQQFPIVLAAVQSGHSSPDALAALFQRAQSAVFDMMTLDTFKKFGDAMKKGAL